MVAKIGGAPAATWPVYLLLKPRLPSRHLSTPRMLLVLALLADRVLAFAARTDARLFPRLYRVSRYTYRNRARRSLRPHRFR